MKNFERFTRSRHLASALAEAPVKGSAVKDAQDELTVVTTRLTNARLAHEKARDADRECAARVRDATSVASHECKKGRATLVAHEVVLSPHAVEEGKTSRSTLARAEFLLARADAVGVKLPALTASREALAKAVAERATLRERRRESSALHEAARVAWDDAYLNAKGTLEIALRRSGVRGEALEQRLEAYFPARVERSTSPEKPPVTPPSMPASGSPLPGSEGTKAA